MYEIPKNAEFDRINAKGGPRPPSPSPPIGQPKPLPRPQPVPPRFDVNDPLGKKQVFELLEKNNIDDSEVRKKLRDIKTKQDL